MNTRKLLTLALVAACCLAGRARAALDLPADLTPEQVKQITAVDPFMGDYEGTYQAEGRQPAPTVARVVADAEATWRVWIDVKTAAGEGEPFQVEIFAKPAGKDLAIDGLAGGVRWTGAIKNGALELGAKGYGGKFQLKHVVKHSKAELAPPPPGALVLLPYKANTPPSLEAWTNPAWAPLNDGSVLARKGDNRTKQIFRNARVHVEFCVPYMPDKTEQARGNSGVFMSDRYETQVLDSYGRIMRGGDCGAIYDRFVPRALACFPPLAWQTYDITFLAPKLGAGGKLAKPAMITTEHNGVLIHDHQALELPTPPYKATNAETGPFKLQDHGNPVRYRNIWLVELDDEGQPLKK